MANDHKINGGSQGAGSLDVGGFLMRHGVFVRGARDAARQALFFLDLLRPCDKEGYRGAVLAYWQPAVHQARGLVRGVHVPTVYKQLTAGKSEATNDERVQAAIRPEKTWQRLVAQMDHLDRMDPLGDGEEEGEGEDKDDHVAQLAEARRLVETFLDESRVDSGERTVDSLAAELSSHYLDNVARWFGRHLGLMLATVLLLGVSLRVEAVQGLFRNEGLDLLWYCILLPLPAYLHLARLAGRRRLGQPAHPWELGRFGFWRIRPLTKTPSRLISRWPKGSKLLKRIALAQGFRLVTYLVLAALAVAGLSWLRSGTPVTVPIVLWIFWAILLAADQLDLWDFLLSQPIRLTALLMIISSLIGMRLGWGFQAFTILLLLLSAVFAALYFRGNKRTPFRGIAAIVFMGLGLATWCALWTNTQDQWRRTPGAATFERLEVGEWPYDPNGTRPVVVMAASGGGSRAAVYTALTLAQLRSDKPAIADELQLISSVSGGSLANAAYVARMARCGTSPAEATLVDATKGDFLFPTLKGALIPFLSRGESIETAWREQPVGLGNCSLGDLSLRWRVAKNTEKCDETRDVAPFPLPMFNSTNLDGHNVVISPLSKQFFTQPDERKMARSPSNPVLVADRTNSAGLAADPLTWVYFRDGIYSLEDLLGDQDLELAPAVRASASFPFGFPVVRIALDPQPDAGPDERRMLFRPLRNDPETVKLTDGGALSNSGMWSLYQLLMNRREELKKRGVLLIIVEASKMPSYHTVSGTINELLGTLGDTGGVARNLHQRMLDVLELEYGKHLATVQLDLLPRESYNVYTTWALDDGSMHKLEASFYRQWNRVEDELDKKWKALTEAGGAEETTCEPPQPSDLIDRRRPPLD